MSVNLTQVIIDSIVEVEIDPSLFLKCAVLRIPSMTTFQLYLKFFVSDTMSNKRNSISRPNLMKISLWLKFRNIALNLLRLHYVCDCLRVDVLNWNTLPSWSSGTGRWFRFPNISFSSVWNKAIFRTFTSLGTSIIVVVAYFKVHHELFGMI